MKRKQLAAFFCASMLAVTGTMAPFTGMTTYAAEAAEETQSAGASVEDQTSAADAAAETDADQQEESEQEEEIETAAEPVEETEEIEEHQRIRMRTKTRKAVIRKKPQRKAAHSRRQPPMLRKR